MECFSVALEPEPLPIPFSTWFPCLSGLRYHLWIWFTLRPVGLVEGLKRTACSELVLREDDFRGEATVQSNQVKALRIRLSESRVTEKRQNPVCLWLSWLAGLFPGVLKSSASIVSQTTLKSLMSASPRSDRCQKMASQRKLRRKWARQRASYSPTDLHSAGHQWSRLSWAQPLNWPCSCI